MPAFIDIFYYLCLQDIKALRENDHFLQLH